MIKGWLKSIPPESLNPQGAGPWRTMFWGIVGVCPGALPLFSCRLWGGGCCWQGTCWTGHPTAAGAGLYPCSSGDVSQPLGFSTHRGEYQARTNKARALESLQVHQLCLLLQSPPWPESQPASGCELLAS